MTNNFGLADLTLDGNRAHNPTAKTDGFYCGVTPGGTDACADVYILRVEATNCQGYGFDPHEQTYRLTIEDRVASHNGLDGFTLDFQVEGVFTGNEAVANDRHGFNIVTTTNDCFFADNIARDNGGAGIVIQRGSDNIAAPSNLLIEGGEISGNASDGIRVAYANDVLISGVDIHDNGRNGIRLQGASHITIEDNTLTDNSRINVSPTAGSNAEVYIVELDDTAGASGTIHSSSYNLVTGNSITETVTPAATYGVREGAGAVDHTLVTGNSIVGMSTGVVLLTSGTSTLDHTGSPANEVLTGGPGSDFISGGLGDDTINGGAGGDTLSGGGGTDRLAGGAGNDHYVVDGIGATIVEQLSSGYDTVTTTLASLTLSSNVEQLIYTGGGNFNGTGNSLDNVLIGGVGNDTLSGNAGNDALIAGGGINTLAGGTGNDVYFLSGGLDTITEGATAGYDTVITTFAGTTTLAANVEQLILQGAAAGGAGNSGNNAIWAVDAIGPVVLDGGAGDDYLYGGASDDTLNGGAGNDTLLGHGGANTLDGGAGNDTFYVERALDTVVELAGGGTDTVISNMAGTTTLATNVEQLILYGAANGGVGSAQDNLLVGVSALGPVSLDGQDGNDILYGGTFADLLQGGNGNDVLLGLGGANVLNGGAGDDVYVLESGLDTVIEAAGGGRDIVFSAASGTTTLANNIETLVLMGAANSGVGNAEDNLLIGNSADEPVTLDGALGNDVLYGGKFADTLIGGAGNDILIGSSGANNLSGGDGDDSYIVESGLDSITELAGGGFDSVFSTVAGTTVISENIEELILYGAATGGVGNDQDNRIYANSAGAAVVVDGAGGDDYLLGSDFGDRLIGGAGNDVLQGNGGSDVFDLRLSGSGADTILDFDADAAGGQDFIDLSGRGFDTASLGVAIFVSDDGAGSALVTVGDDTIKLQGVVTANVTAADFIF